MGRVIDFEARAVATLRRRMAEVEEANRDLVAFARGHSGAVSAIHAAILACMDADGPDELILTVTLDWPSLLGLDAVALAVIAGDGALRADHAGVVAVEPRLVRRAMADAASVTLRGVEQGHPLFGEAASLVRAEALIRMDGPVPGLLLLGQRGAERFETRHGAELLVFLGATLSRMLGRWRLR